MIGHIISHYQVCAKLGEGGMGVVYKAEDTKLQRHVAIKFLPPELTRNAEAKQRFIQEARTASALDHPNICTIYEFSETEDGQLFIVMAYYDQESLKSRIEHGPLPPAEAIDLSMQVAEGLTKAHAKGIIHRDVKPSNIMITSDGIAKIVDFGLAKLSRGQRLTVDGKTMGTIAYMSPEQTRGDDVDQRSDLWSLGVVLYEMLTGKLPFRGEHEQAIIYSIVNEEPEPISVYCKDLPQNLDQIVKTALIKSADNRYQSAGEMADDLSTVAAGHEPLKRKIRPGKLSTRRIKRTFLYGIITALILVLVALGLFFLPKPKAAIASIAVLPLDNYSGDPNQEYFCDGMTDLLISNLSQISSLSVISRTSIMQYKGKKKPLKDIARELGVDAIVEGSVLKSGNRVRITAQLIDAAKDKHLWANNYEQELHDILILQSAVAQAISREIGAQLTPQEKSRLAKVQTINPEAYEAYLKGRFYHNKMDGKDLEYFQQAIRLEPNYAQAYAGLADAYIMAMNGPQTHENVQKARAAVQKALVIDSTLSEAYSAWGFINYMVEGDWKSAEKNLRKALQLNPNSVDALGKYSIYLSAMARHQEAIATIRKAAKLDPLDPMTQGLVSMLYAYARDYDTALTEITKAIELHPDFVWGYYFRGAVYGFKRMLPEAIASFQKTFELNPAWEVVCLGEMAWVYAQAGKRKEVKRIFNELHTRLKNEVVTSEQIAIVYMSLGDFDKAFEYLNKAVEESSNGSILLLKVAPWLDPLRSDPRFKELLKKVKLDN